jgi:hypothetical protein
VVIASDRPNMENADEILSTLGDGLRYFGTDLNDLVGTEKAVSELA